ncbi:MAG: class I SAM-dependent methyltransferase [Acidimicrobiales bacterium]
MSDPADPGRFASDDPSAINRAAAVGFERGAGDYEQARPSYPGPAVDLVVEVLGLGPGRRVLDLAAGTGKFTRLLVPSGADLVAVEPVAAMRDELAARVPGVEAVDGRAEDLPIADGSVDAVVSAQACPWFDAPRALAEVHRVLRADGHLALVWNVRNERVDWVRRFGAILVAAAGRKPYVDGTDWPAVVTDAGGFGPLHHERFTYDQPIDADLLVQRAASTSFVSALPDDERGRCLDEVRELTRTHPDLAGRDTFVFPYFTDVFWCARA